MTRLSRLQMTANVGFSKCAGNGRRRWLLGLTGLLLSGGSIGGCSIVPKRSPELTVYDLGSTPVAAGATTTTTATTPTAATATATATAYDVRAAAALPTLALGEISAPQWMDSTRMLYRLNYENPFELRAYASSRWSMSPPRLFQQRLKARMSEAGAVILRASDGAPNVPQLLLEADDFSQLFASPSSSTARVVMRATVMLNRRVAAQKTFVGAAPAATADAYGGAQALANASDSIIKDLISWLLSVPTKS